MMSKITQPLLSVCLITYNHAPYIHRAIDGVLMQNVNFTYELIIADDCSDDGTTEIIQNYKNKYPDFVKLILHKRNVGALKNWLDLLKASKSRYIAYLEGDDYWIDPNKLQIQIDFLEQNPDYSLVGHNAIVLFDDKSSPPQYFCKINQNSILTINKFIRDWALPSASMVFKNNVLTDESERFLRKIHNGDLGLQLICADNGKVKYVNRVMSVYRKTGNSLSNTLNKEYVFEQTKKSISEFNIYTNYKYNSQIIPWIRTVEKMDKFRKSFPIKFILKYYKLLYINKFLKKYGYFISKFH